MNYLVGKKAGYIYNSFATFYEQFLKPLDFQQEFLRSIEDRPKEKKV